MGRRLLLTVALFMLVPAAAAQARPDRSWALPQIKVVTAHGLMGAKTPADFRPDDPMTRGALENLVFGLQQAIAPPPPPPPPPPTTTTTTDTTGTTTTATTTTPTTTAPTTTAPVAPKQVSDPGGPVTMAQLDARLVNALGLGEQAAQFASGARAAGLTVPSRFGTEAVARLIGLRTNHPANEDDLELLPNETATRAEAAYSAARILGFSGWEVGWVQSQAETFALPPLSLWQKRILTTAVSYIGYPYVWGGTNPFAEAPFGVHAPGGFDCSGYVWRVYKLTTYPGEGDLASVLRGRTTYEMSGEVSRARRIGFAKLQPGDVLFFGDKGPRSKPAQVGHTGIYLGNDWFIHSSDYGVAIAPLAGWYRSSFAWARRPLAEAGLA
jgi:cell wall-associated NlpC family hydrolase